MLKEAEKTDVYPLNIYYLGRDLDKKISLSGKINIRPHLYKLGCSIITESNNSTSKDIDELQHFVTIRGPSNFTIRLPQGCDNATERFLLALGLSHFILHAQAGKNPCFIHEFGQGQVGLEAYYFAIGLTAKLEDITYAVQKGYSVQEIANLFVIPQFAADVAVNGLLPKHINIQGT